MRKKDARALFVCTFLFWLALGISFPIFPLYLSETRHFTVVQFGTLTAYFWALMALLQIPTGLAADRIGRKAVFGIAAIATCLGMWLSAFFAVFALFFISQTCVAFGRASFDGSLNAWAVDRLPERTDVALTEVAQVRNKAVGMSTLVGGIVCGLVMQRAANYGAPLWWAGWLCVIALFAGLIFFGRETEKPVGTSISAIWRDTISAIRHKPIIRALLLLSAIFWFSSSSLLLYWQLAMQAFIRSKSFAGYFTALFGVATVIGITVTWRLTRAGWPRTKLFYAVAVIGGCGYTCLAFGARCGVLWLMILGLILFFSVTGSFLTTLERSLNAYTSDHTRSTMLSCASTVNAVSIAIGHLITSRMIAHFSFFSTWLAAAGVFFLIIPVAILVRRYE